MSSKPNTTEKEWRPVLFVRPMSIDEAKEMFPSPDETKPETTELPRKLIVRIYRFLDWAVGEGIAPLDCSYEPDDLYLELGEIINPDGKCAYDVR